MHQPDYEAEAGSVGKHLRKLLWKNKTNLRGETTYFSNEMLNIKVNKYLAVYKMPETHRHPLFTHGC